jgi:hypothetical protein
MWFVNMYIIGMNDSLDNKLDGVSAWHVIGSDYVTQ